MIHESGTPDFDRWLAENDPDYDQPVKFTPGDGTKLARASDKIVYDHHRVLAVQGGPRSLDTTRCIYCHNVGCHGACLQNAYVPSPESQRIVEVSLKRYQPTRR
jgi:hypothetical protein